MAKFFLGARGFLGASGEERGTSFFRYEFLGGEWRVWGCYAAFLIPKKTRPSPLAPKNSPLK